MKPASTMVEFDPRFEVLPGAKALTMAQTEDPYEAKIGQPIAD